MLDENVWMQLNDFEKIEELQTYLSALVAIEKGAHELSHTKEQGKLAQIKKDLENKIFKIIEIENAT
jgi:hypothetical protein